MTDAHSNLRPFFRAGKMVVTGTKSESMSKTAARKFARIIHKLDFHPRFRDFTLQNIVGSCDVQVRGSVVK